MLVNGWARVLAWASLATEIIIVGTGGSVRLTASGLGCPAWPQCTPGSLVPTPELGFHALVEFSNRMMSGVVAIVALLTFLFLLRYRKSRPELFWLSLSLGILVLVQAGIGGITVLSDLESYIVGLHFVLSAIMVVLAAWLVWSVHLPAERIAPMTGWVHRLAWITAALAAITVVVGILTTGSGPHAGDLGTPRNGLPTEIMEHVHAWPAYALFALTIILVFAAWRPGATVTRYFALWLLGAEFLQIAVGLYQSRNGLPPLAVGVHMVLACMLLAAVAAVVLSTTRPRRAAPARNGGLNGS
ncbi:COX15/CtaA family protein [Terrimesophilobacter mesophilus]|uniref:Heme A synthase n=1 Tax=Terrimesophilobacter mesophilus TaxID=433647 RepID=A0A4R8V6X1_9MICO|nr:COX15/CtaA family protein [Terrimesophilobacter mesophilus]TFB78844.1 heme A synthase [Terrimesophilobacter mesophilus]